MSKYYINKKFKLKRIRYIYDDMRPFERNFYRRRLVKPWKSWAYPVDYSKSPSWWNNLLCTRPARRKTNQTLMGICLTLDVDYNDWPDYKKPNIYYW